MEIEEDKAVVGFSGFQVHTGEEKRERERKPA